MPWARALWPLIFLLPLGILAGRFCWLNIVDPVYHSLVWLHEHLISILLAFAVLSIAMATYRFIQVQDRLRLLRSFRSDPPADLKVVFNEEASAKQIDVRLEYIDVPTRFCFTIFSGPTIVISRGFAEDLSPYQLELVARHEVLHVQRRDPWRSMGWHLFFAGLVLPGFDAPETILHLRRERAVDLAIVKQTQDAQGYQDLLKHCSRRRDGAYGAICTSSIGVHRGARDLDQAPGYLWEHSFPAMVSIATLGLVFFSHSLFMSSLPYLKQHHC